MVSPDDDPTRPMPRAVLQEALQYCAHAAQTYSSGRILAAKKKKEKDHE